MANRRSCSIASAMLAGCGAYHDWIKRFILFHLAIEGHVSASTQNQAFSAILFLYQKVLDVESGQIEGAIRAKRPERLPIILSRDEVKAVLGKLDGVPRLVSLLLYGAGLRILDALRLRIQDVDFARTRSEGKRMRNRENPLAQAPSDRPECTSENRLGN